MDEMRSPITARSGSIDVKNASSICAGTGGGMVKDGGG